MQVQEGIADREDVVGHIGRDLLGDAAIGVSRERAVEVQPVDRRGPPVGDHGVHVVGRHQDEAALDLARIEIADQLPDHRSEEHTSELQSLMRISYAVFCLKKKKHTSRIDYY